MKVRITQNYIDTNLGNLLAGQEHDLPEALARQLVASTVGVEVAPPQPAKEEEHTPKAKAKHEGR